MHYSDRQLQRMLQQDDGDLLASAPDFQHLESCPKCQQRLAKLSGDTWRDDNSLDFVRQALLGQPHVEGEDDFWQDSPESAGRFGGSVTQSITVQIGPSGDWEDESQRRHQVQAINTDFLEPALYPDLLGRLGRYDVEHVIGAGGFGIVLKAHDSDLRRVVALKVLAPHLKSSAAARQRFAREAQTAAAIVHEHVIPIFDVVNTDDHCYLVMQYIAGESLQERVDRQGPLPIEDVLRIAMQAASGLDAAHQQGVVHRDVKPANILLEESVDRVLISDFGLARTADDANLTRSGVITGTPHYMSPEQASGSIVDDRSDLFSLGSVMYFMCTGRPPFRAPQIVAVLNRICNHAHRPISQIQPQIPAPVSDLIDKLLSKDPAKRFRSAAAARVAIAQVLADYQSGKLAADVRLAERYQSVRRGVLQTLSTAGIVGATALLIWGGYQGANQIRTAWAPEPAAAGHVDVEALTSVESPETVPLNHATVTRDSASQNSERQKLASQNSGAIAAVNKGGRDDQEFLDDAPDLGNSTWETTAAVTGGVSASSSRGFAATGSAAVSRKHGSTETIFSRMEREHNRIVTEFPPAMDLRLTNTYQVGIGEPGLVGFRDLTNPLSIVPYREDLKPEQCNPIDESDLWLKTWDRQLILLQEDLGRWEYKETVWQQVPAGIPAAELDATRRRFQSLDWPSVEDGKASSGELESEDTVSQQDASAVTVPPATQSDEDKN